MMTVVSDAPAGPWRDPLGKALIAKGQVPTETRDPGILQEADGTSYIVFGTYDFYIARLSDDMISLAETPRRITIADPEGPYGLGKTDDKPFLHAGSILPGAACSPKVRSAYARPPEGTRRNRFTICAGPLGSRSSRVSVTRLWTATNGPASTNAV